MAKHQVPVMGGMRKVIKTGPDATPGTTIKEIGNQTVTLAQLAALIGAILTENDNPGSPAATIVLGPGLTGGGPVVGPVPIRLDTGPAVLFDVGEGSGGGGGTDGFMIPGPQGVRGPPGQAVFYIPDDGEDGMMGAPAPITPGPRGLQGPPGFDGGDGEDGLSIPGPAGAAGPTGATGATGSGGTGPPGADGEAGEDALMIPGPIGLRGLQGVQGSPGTDGDSGDDGFPGPAGATGATGAAGANGLQGPPGFNGDDGEDPLMIPGAAGATGAAGVAGVNGLQGPPGFNGDDGEDPLMIPGPSGGGASSFANPTAVVGLTAVNGSATTAMRSDASPPIDQGIAPIWTSQHIFQGGAGTPVLIGGMVVAGGLTFTIQNTSVGPGDAARLSVTANTTNVALYAAPVTSTGIVTNGPAGAQSVLRNLGNYPLVFAVNNTYAGQIQANGGWFIPAPPSALTATMTISGAGSSSNQLNLDAPSGSQFSAFGLSNNSVIAAQFYWDSTNTLCVIGSNTANAITHILSGNQVVALAMNANGITFPLQPVPFAANATATLTIAQLLVLIVTSTSAAATSLTLPTGALADAGILGGTSAVSTAFDWSIINTGPNPVTLVAAATGHTIVGSTATATGTSSRWRTRKSAASTFVTYRVS